MTDDRVGVPVGSISNPIGSSANGGKDWTVTMTAEETKTEQSLLDAIKDLKEVGFPNMREIPGSLMRALRIIPKQPAEVIRQQTRQRLLEAAKRLPDEDHRKIFPIITGLDAGVYEPTAVRVARAAAAVDRSDRTVQRWYVEKVVPRIIELLAEPPSRIITYYFTQSHITVDLTGAQPVVITRRTICALSDGVDHIVDRIGTPSLGEKDLTLRLAYGCTVGGLDRLGPEVWSIRLDFPRPLASGEEHAFVVSCQFPDRESLAPLMGFLPYHDSLDGILELEFGDTLPAALDQFTTPPPIDGLHHIPGSKRTHRVKSKHVFTMPRMVPGICYGVKWHWEDPGPLPLANSMSLHAASPKRSESALQNGEHAALGDNRVGAARR